MSGSEWKSCRWWMEQSGKGKNKMKILTTELEISLRTYLIERKMEKLVEEKVKAFVKAEIEKIKKEK